MKKIVVIVLVASVFVFACNNNKGKNNPNTNNNRERDDYRTDDGNNNNNNTGSWSASDVRSFNQQCRQTVADKNLSESQMNQFCSCLLDKMQTRFSSLSEMDQKGTEEDGRVSGEQCMKGITGNTGDNTASWSRTDEKKFMDDCESTARQNVGAQRANEYCDCMLQKVKRIFSSYAEADKGLLQMPKDELDAMVNECNGGQ